MSLNDPLYKYPNYNDIPKYTPLDISNQWDSLYIPYVRSGEINEIVYALENRFAIGKVKNVDCKPRPRNGSDEQYCSLFIHFEYWYNSDFAIFLRYYLNKHGKYDISNYYRYYYKNQQVYGKTYDFHVLINRSRGRTNTDGELYAHSSSKQSNTQREHHSPEKNNKDSDYDALYDNGYSPSMCYPSMCYCSACDDDYFAKAGLPIKNERHRGKQSASSLTHSPKEWGEMADKLEKHERLIELLSNEISALRDIIQKQCAK